MLTSHSYNNALTIFFVSYALAEPVTNVLLKRMTPRIFFTLIIMLWGLMSVMLGVVKTYPQLLGTFPRRTLFIFGG